MTPSLHIHRIIFLSRFLKYTIIPLALLHPTLIFLTLANMSDLQFTLTVLGPEAQNVALSTFARLTATLLCIFPAFIQSIGLMFLLPVISEMQSGRAFVKAAFQCLRRLSMAFVASVAVKIMALPVTTVMLTRQLDETQLSFSVGLNDLQILTFSGAIWLLAWVMAEGSALANENEKFV